MAVTIGICTSARQANIEKFLSTLMSLHLPLINFKMVDLPYNDLDSYRVEQQGLDGLILCHSINNRRFAITDVMDALYDTFLPRARRFIGKENVAVIAHDFDWPYRQGWKSSTMDTFQKKQSTAVACSSLVILCGKLDNSVDMDKDDWKKLLEYASAVQPHKNAPTIDIIPEHAEWCWQIFEAVSRWVKSAISGWKKLLEYASAVQPENVPIIDIIREWCWQIFEAVSRWVKSAISLDVRLFEICMNTMNTASIFKTLSGWVKTVIGLSVCVFVCILEVSVAISLILTFIIPILLLLIVAAVCLWLRARTSIISRWVKSAISDWKKPLEYASAVQPHKNVPIIGIILEWCWQIFEAVLRWVKSAISGWKKLLEYASAVQPENVPIIDSIREWCWQIFEAVRPLVKSVIGLFVCVFVCNLVVSVAISLILTFIIPILLLLIVAAVCYFWNKKRARNSMIRQRSIVN